MAWTFVRKQRYDRSCFGCSPASDGEFDVVPFCWLPGESLLEAQVADHMPYKQMGRSKVNC